MNHLKISMLAGAAGLMFCLCAAFADGVPTQGQNQGPHRRPPREALEACSGKSNGLACSFTSPRGDQIQGTCWQPDSSKPLACKPSSPPKD